MAQRKQNDDFLEETRRAEDILLGSLGFGEDAHIVALSASAEGFVGMGRFSDGEEFEFRSDQALDDLEMWAVETLMRARPDLPPMRKAS